VDLPSLSAFAAERPKRAAALAVWLFGLGETIVWAGVFYVFAAMLLTWEQSLGWTKTELTLGLTVAILAAACMSPIAGRLIDAGHGRWALSLGALWGAAALAGLSTVQTPTMFLLFWAFIGVAQGLSMYEPCFSVVTRARGAAARPAITRITLVAGFASTVSFLAAAGLMDVFEWRTAMLIFAVVVALVGAPMLYTATVLIEATNPDPAPPAAPSENKAALKAALRRPQFWLIAIAFPMMAINHGILLNHIMPLLSEREIPRATAILVASTIGPMQVAGRVCLMLLDKRVSSLMMAGIAFGGVMCASLLLLYSGASPALTFGFAILQGGTYGLTSILKPAITAEFLGRTGFGAINGWLAMPYLAGFALAPYLGALIWGAGGYDLVIMATAGFAAAGAICVFGLVIRKPPPTL
jgi:MFS family permease